MLLDKGWKPEKGPARRWSQTVWAKNPRISKSLKDRETVSPGSRPGQACQAPQPAGVWAACANRAWPSARRIPHIPTLLPLERFNVLFSVLYNTPKGEKV